MNETASFDPNNPLNYPLNPRFGDGVFRRAIRLMKHPENDTDGCVIADMEDCNHGFSLTLTYAAGEVTGITPKARRVPFTTCPQAEQPLQQLVGQPLSHSTQALISQLDVSSHCTHWLDLALLAMAHAARDGVLQRQYRIDIPDETDSTLAEVSCNEQTVHRWQMRDWAIQAPTALAGNTLYRGFARWANATFAHEDEREAAFVLQKGYFVSRARRFDLPNMAGEAAAGHTIMVGACFTYSEPHINTAKRTSGTTRDFTDSEETLLTFV